MKTKKLLSLAVYAALLMATQGAFAQYDANGYPTGVGDQIGSNDGSMDGAGGMGAQGGNNKAEGTPLKIPKQTDIYLLQPLDDSTNTLQASPGIQIFFDYFNMSWPWVLGVCAGLAVLQAMIGGMQIMMSGGGSGRDAGKDRMMWATAGLLIIALAGVILTTINPLFYT